MKHTFAIAVSLLALAGTAAAADSDAQLAAVSDLGHVNGTALACDRMDIVAKAKALMGARVPKTRRFGEAYEQATDAAFREQTANRSSCPIEIILSLRLEAADLKLADVFPPAASSQTEK